MSKDFDIHEWLNYQANLNLLNEEEEEWDLEAGPEWNVKDLGIGDYITPEMFQDNKYGNAYKALNQDFKIVKFKVDDTILPNGNVNRLYDFDIEYKGRFDKKTTTRFQVKSFNDNLLKPEFQVVPPDNLNEEEDDEFSQEFIAGPEWNVKELNVGDVVTPEMWDQEKIKNIDDYIINDPDWFEKPHKITKFRPTYLDFVIFDNNKELSLRFVNNFLKPNFKINFPGLNEQDEDEWEFTAGEEWNEYDGTVVITYVLEDEGYVYIDDDDVEEFDSLNPGALDKFDYNDEPIRETNVYKSKPVHIRDLINELDELVGVQAQPYTGEKTTQGFKDWMADNGIDIDSLAYLYDILSPTIIKTTYQDDYGNPVKITPEMKNRIDYGDDGTFYGGVIDVKFNDRLTESDDEWDLEAGPEWNEKTLKVGDKLTPEMFKDYTTGKHWSTVLDLTIKKIDWKHGKLTYIAKHPDGDKNIGQWDLKWTERELNPGFGFDLPLNEQDDEWDFTAGPEWNETLLSTGDKITPEMWDEKAVIDAGEEDFFLEGETWTIIEIDNTWISIKSNEGGFLSWDVDSVQALLKPEYKIVVKKDLFEEEDEWDLEAGPEWDVTELGIGDTITPNMWNKNLSPEYGDIGDWIDNPAEAQIIDDIDTDDNGVVGVWFTGKKSNIQNIYTLLDFNNLLDPKYQIVPPLHESEENEWNLEAGPEWGVQELWIGDVITPDMWNNDLPDEWYDEFQGWELEIGDFKAGDEVVALIGSGVYYVDLEEFNSYLEPKYQIVPPLNEQEEDEWDFEAGPEWNIEELVVGDYITPDMWDWQKIGAYIDSMNYDDHEEYRRNWEEWEEGTKNPIKILKIHNNNGDIYSELDSTFLRWEPSLYFINKMLKPKFKVVPPLNESEDDEWDLEAGEEWNTKELTTGDYITPEMWDWQEIGAFIDRMNDGDHEEYRRDWQEWEEGTKNPVKILKIYGHGVSTYPELDSYLFRWGPNIRFINQMLKPEFKVIVT